MKKTVFILTIVATLLVLPVFSQTVPQPDIPTSNYLVGTFYFPAWRLNIEDQSNDYGWLSIQDYPERKPLLGYYDEGNPEVMDWEIKWATENGVNFFIFLWSRCNQQAPINTICSNNLDKTIQTNNLPRHQALHDGFLQAEYNNKMKFTIMLNDILPYSQTFSSLDDLENNLMPYLINNYFKHQSYLKINNKPVLFTWWNQQDLITILGSEEKVKEAILIMKNSVKDAGFSDLIIMGHDWNYVNYQNMYASQKLKDYGFDYSFSYIVPYIAHGSSSLTRPTEQEVITHQKLSHEYLFSKSPIPFILTVSPFWNNYPYKFDSERSSYYLSQENYKTVINNAKNIMNQVPESELGHNMIILDAWNEYGEGHYIAPDVKNNFDYLKSIRQTLTNNDNTPDYRLPNDIGMGPYDSLFQEYVSKHIVDYSFVKNNKYTFNKKNDFIDVVNYGFNIENSDRLTFGAWIKPSLNTENYIPFEKPFTARIVLGKNGNGHCVISTKNNAWYSTGTTVSWSNNKLKKNEWTHVLCVYGGSNLTLFIDGEKIKSSSSAISGKINNRPFRLRLGFSPEAFDTSSLAGFVFENKALNDNEVKSLYELSKPIQVYSTTKRLSFQNINGATIQNEDYHFDGINDYIEIQGYNFDRLNKMSFEAVFNPSDISESTLIIDKGFTLRAVINPDGSGHCIFATENNEWYSSGSAASWSMKKIKKKYWNHLVCVYDGSKTVAYINGVKVGESGLVTGELNNRPTYTFNIGKKTGSNTNYFNGQVKEVKVYKYALTQSEVVKLFNELNFRKTRDFNNDGSVNFNDAEVLVLNFGTINIEFDLNDDGNVNILDLIILSKEI